METFQKHNFKRSIADVKEFKKTEEETKHFSSSGKFVDWTSVNQCVGNKKSQLSYAI